MATQNDDLDDELDEELEDDELDEELEDEEEEKEADGLTAAEAAELEEKYRRANKRAKKYRKALAAGRKPADDDDPELTAATQAATAATTIAKRALVRAAIAEAGGNVAAVRLVNLDDLEIDEDGDLDGIDDALDALRAEVPELFAKDRKPAKRRKAPTRGGDGTGGRQQKKQTADELLLASFRGTRDE